MMKWHMAEKDVSVLHTPIVTLNSPFTEAASVSTVSDRSSEGLSSDKIIFWSKERESCGKRRKMKLTTFARNERHSRIKNSAKTVQCAEGRTCDLEEQEFLSLQIQRAMIADEDGDRPIHIAVAQEDAYLVKKLCAIMKKGGASLDLRNSLRQTPLHVAVITGNHKAISHLLRSGASLKLQDRNGNNAIHLGVKHFQAKAFSTLLSYCHTKSILDACDYDGLTSVHHAVNQRNAIAVKGLCKAGANVNACDGKSGRSPLAHATLSGHMDMVNVLLECKAQIERPDYSGQNALELALLIGNRTMIRRLETKTESALEYKTDRKRKSNSESPRQEKLTKR